MYREDVQALFPSFVDQILIAIPSQPVQRAPPTVDMDEDTQLQLALSLSKEEHQQVGFLGVTGGDKETRCLLELLLCNAENTVSFETLTDK